MINKLIANIVYFLIICLGLAIIFFYKPVTADTPKGLVLPVSDYQSPLPLDAVRVYDHQLPNAKRIGQIHLELNGVVPLKTAEAKLIQQARLLAASIGANAVYIKEIGRTEKNKYGFSLYFFTAEALTL